MYTGIMPTKTKSLGNKSWKDIQSKRKKDHRNKLALLVLGLLAGLIVLSWMVRLTQSLFSPWKLSAKTARNYIWDANFNINLVVKTEHVAVATYNPAEKSLVILNLPDESFMEVPGGFGFWQLRAVYRLGESEKGPGGDQLLMQTLRDFLAVPIDGFLDFSGGAVDKSATEVLTQLKQNPLSGFSLMSSLKTNLTLWELLRLKSSLSGVRFDKVKEIDLGKLDILTQETLPDGSGVMTADPVKLDSVLVDLADSAITSEHKSIAVFNATNRPQLAQKAARLITNLGGNVIITSNAENKLTKTYISGSKSLTLKRLEQIFAPDDKISTPSANPESARAEINIFLGEDYR